MELLNQYIPYVPLQRSEGRGCICSYCLTGVLLLRKRKVLSDPLHLLGVAIEQISSGTPYTRIPPSPSYPL
jgi:hypothetical protein